MALTLLLLILIVASLKRNKQSARHLPVRISDSMEARDRDEPPKPSGQHPAFLLYPIIYIICTAPLAIGRMASMAGAKPGWIFYGVAGSMIASHGESPLLFVIGFRHDAVMILGSPCSFCKN
jgi:hypothetical protein